ncbi:hypothetical protein [Gordonia rhizosphera]|uniref:DUF8175 domain-containing protein n=1 Tax=Gordonia rhizosphera NBRC 16068 TaxID=1108045 RepID=K6WCZ6_9ACTN|nr:hypothetical protein [Gordonia rhizosphera]GAB91611.1 hypothetical protein GORHZ_139_00030 [Gordonia rhizosphera NBRC 16068]
MTAATLAAAAVLAGCGSQTPPTAPAASIAGVSIAGVAPTAPPTGLSWTSFQGMAIPVADQGPHTTIPLVAPHGFDHTGPGAALAAINATVRMSVAADDQWATVADLLLAPGAARDSWSVNRVRLSITAPVAAVAPRICGYEMTRYTPHRADVSIVTRHRDDSLTANAASVVWSAAGDWQLQLPDPSAQIAPVTAIDTLPSSMITLAGQC